MMTCQPISKAMMVAAAMLALTSSTGAQQPAAQPGGDTKTDRVAALKQSLQQGQALIRKYEWVETTIISMKGEEKARKQNRCYYGADGKVQKTPIAGDAPKAAAESGGGGRSGRRGGGKVKEHVVENKKGEIQDYMEGAVALIHQYVPPDPARIQAAKEGGRIKAEPQAGGQARLQISEYLKPKDSMTIDIDGTANRLLGLGVNTYLDKPDEPVTLAVQMSALPDGATYAAQTTLEATAKNIRVVIQNSGHRPLSQ